MSRAAVLGFITALAAIAAVAFVAVAVTELGYASDHPYRYGPAKVIATAAGAGALLAVSVVLLAATELRRASGLGR